MHFETTKLPMVLLIKHVIIFEVGLHQQFFFYLFCFMFGLLLLGALTCNHSNYQFNNNKIVAGSIPLSSHHTNNKWQQFQVSSFVVVYFFSFLKFSCADDNKNNNINFGLTKCILILCFIEIKLFAWLSVCPVLEVSSKSGFVCSNPILLWVKHSINSFCCFTLQRGKVGDCYSREFIH